VRKRKAKNKCEQMSSRVARKRERERERERESESESERENKGNHTKMMVKKGA